MYPCHGFQNYSIALATIRKESHIKISVICGTSQVLSRTIFQLFKCNAAALPDVANTNGGTDLFSKLLEASMLQRDLRSKI